MDAQDCRLVDASDAFRCERQRLFESGHEIETFQFSFRGLSRASMGLDPAPNAHIDKELAIHRTWTLDARPEGVIPGADYESLLVLDHNDSSDDPDRSFKVLMPLARRLVAEYRDQIGSLDEATATTGGGSSEPQIPCLLCPGKKPFRGWGAFVIHLSKYWKHRVKQHRGFLRALKEALNSELATLHAVKWPPVLIVGNSDGATFDGKLRRFKGLQGEEIPHNLAELKIQEVLAVYSKGGEEPDSRIVVAFPASEIGFVDAKQLELRPQNQTQETPKPTECSQEEAVAEDRRQQQQPDERSTEPAAADIKKQWIDADYLKQSPGLARLGEDWDEEKERLAANCPLESFLPMLSEAEQCDYLREKWARSFEATKKLAFKLPKPFKKSKQMQNMEQKFQKDLQKLDHLNADSRRRIRLQLEEIEKQLHRERLNWLRNIDAVRNQFDHAARDLCKQEANKKLQKDMKIVKAVKERLSLKGNDRKLSSVQEKALQDQAQFEKRRRFLLAKYQEEQVSFKKHAEEAKRQRIHLMNVFQSNK